MLRLENYSLNFDSKVVFENTSFFAENGQLTLITGESGSGKTTLLNSLILNNDFFGSYYYDNQLITELDSTEKDRFISVKTCMIEQFPAFLNDLTVEQHFQLFGNNYLEYDKTGAIERLGIERLMQEYPNQLSDGEKKRVSLCLAFIRNPQILFVDEPTASLNEEYIKIVCQLLNDYSKKGHYVIVSSHDTLMKNYADTIYHIQYQKIKRVLESNIKNNAITEKKDIYLNFKLYLSMFISYIKNKFIYFIIIVLLISLVGVSYEFNNTAILVHKNIVNDLSSKEIKVYKSMAENNQLMYSEDGNESPVTNKELEYLKLIPHIQQVDWRFDYKIWGNMNEDLELDSKEIEVIQKETLILNEDRSVFKNIQNEVVLENILFKTYVDRAYAPKIEKDFNKKGVYISKALAETLTENINELEGKLLQFPLLVPVYDVSGVSSTVTETGEEFQINTIASKRTVTSLPIAGVLKGKSLYDTDDNSSWSYQIFVPQEYISKGVEENKKDQEMTIYHVGQHGNLEKYINEIPEDKKNQIVQIIKATPWQPNCYIVTIDDLTYLNTVLQEINEIGLNASCVYIDSTSLKASVESVQNGVQIVGGIILLMLMFITYQIKKNNSKIEKEGNRFLENMGLTNKEIKEIKQKKYFIFFILETLVCLMVGFIITLILNYTLYGNTNFSIGICVIIIIVTFIIEFIYPKYIERK